MALTSEWRDRINSWQKELKNHFYRKLGAVAVSGFATGEQLTPSQAAKGGFKPIAVGAKWGAKWEYGWFRCTVTVPRSAAGQRIVFRPSLGGEMLVLVDGREAGAVSWGREEITLTRKASGGEKFTILMEAYAGHGKVQVTSGPVPIGRVVMPEPAARQAEIGETSFGIWEDSAFELHVDVAALLSLRDKLDENSLRQAEIDRALREFTNIVDFELPLDEMIATFVAARKVLAPALACRNGSTAPTIYAFGHGHLDVAWLWPLAETERKAARTLSSQLELIDEYPQYRFLQSEPHLYWMVKNRYPELYKRVKRAVKSGRLIADGAMWVEPDMNIAGGEALIRQCIHGKRFFREEFGIDNELLWLPDVFGYSAALPQILQGCGVKYFATAKIFWNYHGGDKFPLNLFVWEGIDGTPMLAHLFHGYGGNGSAGEMIGKWNDRPQKEISCCYGAFGHGDGGGGPTREHVENVMRLSDLEGCPKVKLTSPAALFKDIEKAGVNLPRYVGELYFQAHRGTYTSQSRTKRGNRKSELAMREAEMWGSVASATAGFKFPFAAADELWKKILLNQFHDILPGSSIARVYEEAEASYAEVIESARAIADRAVSRIVRGGKAVTVFNSLNWDRSGIVELPSGSGGAVDADGKSLCVQEIRGKKYVEASVPSCGWTTIKSVAGPCKTDSAGPGVQATQSLLENDQLKVKFDGLGRITSIFDKQTGRELASGPCNEMRMFKDVPSQWDAWDVDSCYQFTPVALKSPAKVEVVAAGPLLGCLKITRKINNSTYVQEVVLRRRSRRIDFHTRVDWNEKHKMLKVGFDVDIQTDQAVHEIQFGHVRRPNHDSRQYDFDRFEVANHKWTALAEEGRGCAVLNDCKYGVNVRGKSINLTLLRAPQAPDPGADLGKQEFTYAFYAWNGSLADCDLVRQAYELNVPVITARGEAGRKSILSVDSPNVVVESVKPAEDGSSDVIIRLYEAKNSACKCNLALALPVKSACLVNMLEDKVLGRCAYANERVALQFRPFEIKTLRLVMKKIH